MAAYDYLCRTCDRIVEVRATFAERTAGLQPMCPTCRGEDLRRIFTPLAVAAAGRSATAAGGCCGGGCGCG